MELHQLKRIIEAALLASAQPLTLPQISGLFDEFAMPPQEDLAKAIAELQADSAERGIELVEVASGFRYQIRHDVHPFVSKLWTERQTRYSRALLETLALIAYRQPITRAEIEQIRGVAVSTNIIRTLEEREWVRVVGYRDLPGKPALFGTTKQFLDYFNLKSLDQLPALSEIRDLDDEPQLALDGEAIPANVALEESDAEPDADGETAVAETETAAEAATTEAADTEGEGERETIEDDAPAAEAAGAEEEAISTEAVADAEATADEHASAEPNPEAPAVEETDTQTAAVEEDAESTTARAEPPAGATSGKTTEPAA